MLFIPSKAGIWWTSVRHSATSCLADTDQASVLAALIGRFSPALDGLAKGLKPPADVTEAPTSRAMKWTAHLYRFGFAVGSNPTKTVQEGLGLPRSTVGRWIAKARQAGYLGRSEGVGKAGG